MIVDIVITLSPYESTGKGKNIELIKVRYRAKVKLGENQ